MLGVAPRRSVTRSRLVREAVHPSGHVRVRPSPSSTALALDDWRTDLDIPVPAAQIVRDALDELPALDLPWEDVVSTSNRGNHWSSSAFM